MQKQLPTNLLIGGAWILAYSLMSVMNDTITKLLTPNIPASQIVFCRFFFGALSLLSVLLFYKEKIKSNFIGTHAIRAFLLFIGMLLYTYSLKSLPLAVNIVGCFSIPIFVSILAYFVLGENIKSSIFNTILGFAGVLVAFYPYLILENYVPMLFLMGAVILFSTLDIINKVLLVKNESTVLIMFYTALFSTLFSIPTAACAWTGISYSNLFALMFLGAGGNVVFYCLLKGFSYAPIAYMQPFKYTELPFSILSGYLIFNDNVHYSLVIGCLIIIFSAAHTTYKYNKIKQEAH